MKLLRSLYHTTLAELTLHLLLSKTHFVNESNDLITKVNIPKNSSHSSWINIFFLLLSLRLFLVIIARKARTSKFVIFIGRKDWNWWKKTVGDELYSGLDAQQGCIQDPNVGLKRCTKIRLSSPYGKTTSEFQRRHKFDHTYKLVGPDLRRQNTGRPLTKPASIALWRLV